ncbi:uncharacterized protein LOC113207217 isoform X2 [Frankliniella occidentalis]|uniref:Uncharacterized protein LOC113207217 isoform X2 n=1 Tax=Frankliniella occidentalis TaxID=133901 RepID=A0A6J1SJE9_FRAOC|nr:uncharacterized protein LOC113207217 isoform X2 [Frankliniella occidentalis]
MEKPWEIVKKFQQQLYQAPMPYNVRPNKPLPGQVKAVHHFLPSNGLQDAALRIKKVKDIVDESTRIADESRPRFLSNTNSSFCQNCNCENCLNQSSILGPPESNLNRTIPDLIQSFEVFLQTQRQQFMQMINQLTSVLDSSNSSFPCQQSTSNVLKSTFPVPQLTLMECDSSEKTKCINDCTSRSVQCHISPTISREEDAGKQMLRSINDDTSSSTRCDNSPTKSREGDAGKQILSSPCESPSSTVHAGDDGSSTTSLLHNETENISKKHNFIKPRVPEIDQANVNFKSNGKVIRSEVSVGKNSNNLHDDHSSFCSEDISFRPLRKSSILRMKDNTVDDWSSLIQIESDPVLVSEELLECSVKIDKLNTNNSMAKKKKTHARDGHKSANSLIHCSTDKVSLSVSETTVPVCRTRSGRAVEKPRQYWLSKTQDTECNSTRQAEIPKSKSGNKSTRRRRKDSQTSNIIPETNLVLEDRRKPTKSEMKGSAPALKKETLKKVAKVLTAEPEQSLLTVSKKGITRAKKAKAESSVDKSEDDTRNVQLLQQVNLNLEISNNASKKGAKISNNKQVLPRQEIDQNAGKINTAKRKVPHQVKDNQTEKSGPENQGPKMKRKKKNPASTNASSKRQKTMINIARKLSTDSTEPDYECYFTEEQAHSWLES